MAYYKLSEVEEIFSTIKQRGFLFPLSLLEASIQELQRQFNGTGSDSMPFVLRKALSKLLRLKCTVAIHDWDYYKSDGTKEGQKEADERFFFNGHREIYLRLSWFNPLRYWALYKLNVAYKLLQQFGESAYISAHERYSTKD